MFPRLYGVALFAFHSYPCRDNKFCKVVAETLRFDVYRIWNFIYFYSIRNAKCDIPNDIHLKPTGMKQSLSLLFLSLGIALQAQVTLQVTVTSGSSTTTCTDLFSDPNPHWGVNVAASGWVYYPQAGFCFNNFPNTQYSQTYGCLSTVPSTLQICYRAFEDDGVLCNVVTSCLEEICGTFNVPALGSSSTHTLTLPNGLSSGGTVTFTVELTGTPIDAPNDDICTPINLGLLLQNTILGDASLSNYNNYCATATNEPDPANDGAPWANTTGVWFTFTTGPDILPYIDITVNSDPQNLGDPLNTQIALYGSSDNTCNGAMTMLAQTYTTATFSEQMRVTCLDPNSTYWLLVDGAWTSPTDIFGFFGVSIQTYDVQEGGDFKCDSELLGTVPDGGSISTPGARSNHCSSAILDPFIPSFISQRSVWFHFFPPASGHVRIDCNNVSVVPNLPPIGAQIALFRSANNQCTGFFTHVASQYDFTTNDEFLEVSCLDPNRPYWILIDGDGTVTTGTFTVTITDLGSNTPVTNQSFTLCAGGSVQVGNSTYTQTGQYSNTILLANGCDSIVHTNLTVLAPLEVNFVIQQPASAIGAADGVVQAQVSGGLPGYSYFWSNGQFLPTAIGLIGGTNYCLQLGDANGCSGQFCLTMPVVVPLEPVVTNDALACFGDTNGSVTLTVLGGVPPYTYTWQNASNTLNGNGSLDVLGASVNINNLPAGIYTITVNDGFNDAILTATVTEPPLLQVNIQATAQPLCTNDCTGSISTLPIGGTQPYQYAWNNLPANLLQPANLCADVYTLTITDSNGCTATGSATIINPPPFEVNATLQSAVSCFGGNNGSATLSASNGIPASYVWSNGQTNATLSGVQAGNYAVTVTSTLGCTAETSVLIPQPNSPVFVNISLAEAITCFGIPDGELLATAGGHGSNFTYAWSNSQSGASATNLGPGTYSVVATNEFGCQATASSTLTQPTEITLSFESVAVTCPEGPNSGAISISDISGGEGPYLTGLDSPNFGPETFYEGLSAGNYLLYVLDALGCVREFPAFVEAPPPVEVSLGADREVNLGETLPILAQTNDNPNLLFTWLPVLPCLNDDCSIVGWEAIENAVVQVQVLDTTSLCTASDQILLRVVKNRRLYLPNVFSPNFDGSNDVFTIFAGPETRLVRQLRIYDRWGTEVFSATNFEPGDHTRGWDGTHNGKAAPIGVYAYFAEIVYVDSEVEIVRGSVTLVR
jgi:gliding motility-associated-like protein